MTVMARKLSVVTDESPPPKVADPTKLADAVDLDEATLLRVMRAKIAADIDGGVPAAYLAPLVRQLKETDKEIRALALRATQEAASNGPTEDEVWSAI